MISRIGVAAMGLCLLLYILTAGHRGVILLTSGEPVATAMGAAVLILPLVGLWALVRELMFGLAASRLTRVLVAEGDMPADEVALTPSGRIVKEEAAPLLAKYASAAETDDGWRAQFRLGVVQDAAGQRKDARASIREAIRREKAGRGSSL